ncbi:hypothetical protein E2C01_016618 [Portunus trituberculatus]|uniref:Uncharacterized protein n=1 Tax=Portunus trituberculatus TaxID=210409 RepID=A0A5B7DPJ8_PORTR|nr:hypothetical protein [Portunus trituberculatus]
MPRHGAAVHARGETKNAMTPPPGPASVWHYPPSLPVYGTTTPLCQCMAPPPLSASVWHHHPSLPVYGTTTSPCQCVALPSLAASVWHHHPSLPVYGITTPLCQCVAPPPLLASVWHNHLSLPVCGTATSPCQCVALPPLPASMWHHHHCTARYTAGLADGRCSTRCATGQHSTEHCRVAPRRKNPHRYFRHVGTGRLSRKFHPVATCLLRQRRAARRAARGRVLDRAMLVLGRCCSPPSVEEKKVFSCSQARETPDSISIDNVIA